MPRIVVVGCGTGVGKTRLSVALLRELGRRGEYCLGLKPVETGIPDDACDRSNSDAAQLSLASSVSFSGRHPLYAFPAPISPHLAARQSMVIVDELAILAWAKSAEAAANLSAPSAVVWSLVETAGGVFSPLSVDRSNFDLARALDPAIWVLVAPDSLGVLHEVRATLLAMRASGRSPDHVVLSAAREPDMSTGTNAAELHTLRIASVSAVLGRDDDTGVRSLVQRLLRQGEGVEWFE